MQIDGVLEKVVEMVPRVLAVDYCGIFLWSEEERTYQGAGVSGVDLAMAHHLSSIPLSPKDVPDFEWVRPLGQIADCGFGARDSAMRNAPVHGRSVRGVILSGGH